MLGHVESGETEPRARNDNFVHKRMTQFCVPGNVIDWRKKIFWKELGEKLDAFGSCVQVYRKTSLSGDCHAIT